MSEHVLDKIIKKKSEKIESLKKTITINSLNDLIDKNNTYINFKEKIEKNISNKKFSISRVYFLIYLLSLVFQKYFLLSISLSS